MTGGLDYATAYMHRGYLHQEGGLLLQPYATLACGWSAAPDFSVTPYVTSWQSFQLDGRENPSRGGVALHRHKQFIVVPDYLKRFFGDGPRPVGSPNDWYQGELMAGTAINWHELSLDMTYNVYTYPNGPALAIEEVGFRLRYEVPSLCRDADAKPWCGFRPWVALYREIVNRYDRQGTYLEFGAEPWTHLSCGEGQVGVAVPTVIGMSLDDYYTNARGQNAFVGYVSQGISASAPLPLPSRWGNWYWTGSFRYVRLLAENLKLINKGADQFIGSMGIGFAY